jgi:hypothetical protein
MAFVTFIASGSQVAVGDDPAKLGYFGYNLKSFMQEAKDVYNKLGLAQDGIQLVFEVDHFGFSWKKEESFDEAYDNTYAKLKLAVGLGWSVLLDYNKLIDNEGADLPAKYDQMLETYCRMLAALEEEFPAAHFKKIGFEVAFGDIKFEETEAIEDVAYCQVRLKQLLTKYNIRHSRISLVEKPTGTGHGVAERSDFKIADVADTASLCYVAGNSFSQHGASAMSVDNQRKLGEALVTHIHLFTDLLLGRMLGLLEADPELFIAFVDKTQEVIKGEIENGSVTKNTAKLGKDKQRLYPEEIFAPEVFDQLRQECRRIKHSRSEQYIQERRSSSELHLAWFILEWSRYLADKEHLNQLIYEAYQNNWHKMQKAIATMQAEYETWAENMNLFDTAPLLKDQPQAFTPPTTDIQIDAEAEFTGPRPGEDRT